MLRTLVFLCWGLSLAALGCGRSEQASLAAQEAPEQAAVRVYSLAQKLEKEHKTKEAFDAYHQIARRFPQTPEGKKAAQRISQAQKEAVRNSAVRRKR